MDEEVWIVGHDRDFYPDVEEFSSREEAEIEFDSIVAHGSSGNEEKVYLARVVRRATLPGY